MLSAKAMLKKRSRITISSLPWLALTRESSLGPSAIRGLGCDGRAACEPESVYVVSQCAKWYCLWMRRAMWTVRVCAVCEGRGCVLRCVRHMGV